MKPRLLIMAGFVALLALLVSLSIATAGTKKSAQTRAAVAMAAPKVPNASAIKAKYGGQSITFVGDSVGGGHLRDTSAGNGVHQGHRHQGEGGPASRRLGRRPTHNSHGAFSTHSSSIDVAMIDVVWPGAFAPFLVDLKPKLGSQAKIHAQGIIKNDTINEKSVAMPRVGDFGMLYYRTDLLQKYGYSAPPTTWDDLFTMAKKIQDGEQASNPNFTGFVFQGNAYEGLTGRRPRVDRVLGRRQLHRLRQGHNQQQESGRGPQPVPPEHRRHDAARRNDVPGGRGADRVHRR